MFRDIELRIHQDLWGFVGFMKTGQILWKSVYESNPRTKSFENIKDSWSTIGNETGFVSKGTNQTLLESGFVTPNWYETMDSQNESMGTRFLGTIPASLATNKRKKASQKFLVFPKFRELITENVFSSLKSGNSFLKTRLVLQNTDKKIIIVGK